MKRHFQCAEQQEAASNFTNCCACHTKWMSPVICDTYQTSFPMRGASEVTLQPHQMLRLPHKMNVTSDLRHISNVISNARSKQRHPATSPKYCACHAKCKSSMICVTYATSFPMRGGSKVTLQPHQTLRLPRNLEAQDFSGNSLNASANRKSRRYPTIKSSSRTRRFRDLTRPILETILYCKIQHFASRLSPKMSRSAAPVTKSHPPTSPNTAPATQNELWTVTLLNCDCTELWLHSIVTVTELLLYWIVTVLNCDFTELWLYWTVTVLNCDFTELLLDWSVTWLICYFTDLLLHWSTELWLYWTVSVLNCDFTELLLDWSVTWLICYFTDLLLDWSVTLLICYFTDLLLYWTVTWLICYLTDLLLYWSVTSLNFKHF